MRALLLAVGVLALAVAVWQLRRKAIGVGSFALAGGIVLILVYLSIDQVPGDFTAMTPYVITLLVLAFASQRLRMPAADGQTYRKGSAG